MSEFNLLACALSSLAFYLLGLLLGYNIGHIEIRELEEAGYKIVQHEIRHGEFQTNWV